MRVLILREPFCTLLPGVSPENHFLGENNSPEISVTLTGLSLNTDIPSNESILSGLGSFAAWSNDL